MSEYTLYTNPQSRGVNVQWMLEECEANYKAEILDFGSAMKTASYLAINPMGKVPALKHGQTVITETAAILLYLGEQFPEKALIPPSGSAERGELYRLLFLAIHCEYAIFDRFFGIEETPERSKALGYGNYATVLETLRTAIADKTYVIGSQFTLLDIYLSGFLQWAMHFVNVVPKDDPIFNRYLENHLNRPAVQKIMAQAQS